MNIYVQCQDGKGTIEGWESHEVTVGDAAPGAEDSLEQFDGDAWIMTTWRLMRRCPREAVLAKDKLYISVSREELEAREMLPGERQLLRQAKMLFCARRDEAVFCAKWLAKDVAVAAVEDVLTWLTDEHPKKLDFYCYQGPPPATICLMRSMGVDGTCLEAVAKLMCREGNHFRWHLSPAPPMATVAWARSKCLSDFMTKTDGEVAVMWDGDMVVSPQHVEDLAITALELDSVVGTLLCKRIEGRGWVNKVDRPEGFDFPDDRVWELKPEEYNGAALVAYPRTALNRIAAHLPFVQPHGVEAGTPNTGFYPFFLDGLIETDDGMQFMTEDRTFCDLARSCGEKLYLSLSQVVKHVGVKAYIPQEGQIPGVKPINIKEQNNG